MPWLLALFALAVSLVAVVPLIYIIVRALSADPATWQRLWVGQMPDLLVQSAALLVGTIAFTLVVGIAAAWLVERTDLPGRGVWRVLLALPLDGPGIGFHSPVSVHVVILGFGRMGRSLALRAAKMGHFANRKPLRLSVIDRHAAQQEQGFLFHYPALATENICRLDFHPAETPTASPWPR